MVTKRKNNTRKNNFDSDVRCGGLEPGKLARPTKSKGQGNKKTK